jgi:release factor glutamine methyltransferase
MVNVLEKISGKIKETSDSPAMDAQSLLAHITGFDRTYLMAHPEIQLTRNQEKKLSEAISRLNKNVPLPYILGHWEFFGLDLIINQDVLIPRPETELLVEKALDWLHANPEKRRVIDVGTGSGCIAVAIADKVPDIKLIAGDISRKALKVARQNARKFDVVDRVKFYCCDLFPPYKKGGWRRFFAQGDRHSIGADLILANLPYIPTSSLKDLKVYGREPEIALDGGFEGLDVIRKFISLAPTYLAPGGRILMEIEEKQGMAALSLAYDQFSEARIHLHQDLSGKDRFLDIHLLS